MSERGTTQQLSLIAHEPQDGGISVRESARARRLAIHVSPQSGVEVVVPRNTSSRKVHSFVREHAEWIEKTRAELASICPPRDTSPPARIVLPALEREWAVVYRYGSARSAVRSRGAQLLQVVTDSGDPGECRRVLRRWLAAQARSALGGQLAALAQTHGFRFKRMQIRGQRTRWGSCSSRGTISLNYCLVFLAPALVRYLLIHELCHTRVMSHSAAFWDLVRCLEPDCRRLDRRLDEAWKQVPAWAVNH